MSKTVDILLLADRDGKSLWPLTETIPPCLLPVAGKPLIIHALESIGACVTADVTVVVASGDEITPAALAGLGFPTLKISVTNLPRPFVDSSLLAVRGDIVPSTRTIEEMIMAIEEESALTSADEGVGAWRLAAGQPVPTWRETAILSDNDDRILPGLAAYWRMAISAVASDGMDLHPAGWLTADGMRVGMNARVLTRRAPGRGVSVGADAFIDRNVILGDCCVIGDRAWIARGARISRSVVMPDTYVGAGVVLDQAIACGNWLCHIETGEVTRIADQTIIARLAA